MVTPVLVGCTASGKTALLLRLRERHDFQVVSADSRQVYRGMDRGTAKPTMEERSFLKHHLIDFLDPGEVFSAGDFAEAATLLISSIRGSGSVPMVSGGTALYVMALTGGFDPMPGRDGVLRRGLEKLEKEKPGILGRLLERVDPETCVRLGRRDVTRQVRALEIFALSGIPPSRLRKGGDASLRKKFVIAGIRVPPRELRCRIASRTEKMIADGLVEEVGGLMERGWGRESALGRTIGYRETMDFIEGRLKSISELQTAIEVNTWRLARRQRNMFRRIRDVVWYGFDEDWKFESLFFDKGEA